MSDTSYIKIMNEYKKLNNINEIIKKGTDHHINILKIVDEKKQ